MRQITKSRAPGCNQSKAQYQNAHINNTPSADPLSAFKDFIRDCGLIPPEVIEPGRWHRSPGRGKRPGNTAAAIKMSPDRRVGFVCDHSTGLTEIWKGQSTAVISPAERAELDAQIAAAKATQERAHKATALRASRIRNESKPASPEFKYFVVKGVTPNNARFYRGRLALPVYDFDGCLWSLQFISPDGDKKLLKGGRKKGCFIPVAGRMPASRVLICEGWATGATLAENEPSALVLAAVDAGNLKAVATGARNQWPDAEIIVCADADEIGREKGRAAAIAAGALFAVPEFPAGVEGTDFNDLAALGREVY